jgi:hypothetical protein
MLKQWNITVSELLKSTAKSTPNGPVNDDFYAFW